MSSTTANDGRIVSLAGPNQQDFDAATRSSFIIRNGSAAQIRTYRNGASLGLVSITYNSPFVATSIFTGASNTIYRDGTAGTTAASSGNFGYTQYGIANYPSLAAGSARLVGNVYEVILYNQTLSSNDRQTVEGYLAWKWGLPTNLLGTHAYRYIPPLVRPFAPSDISSTALWLDAGDPSGILVAAGTSNITTWFDKSGNFRHLVQATAGSRPTYVTSTPGDAYVNFVAASSQFLDVSDVTGLVVNRPFSIFLVENRTSNNGQNYWFGGTGGASNQNLHTGYRSDSQATMAYFGNDLNANIPTFATNSNVRVWGMVQDTVNRYIYANGSNLSQAANATFVSAWAGAAMGKYGTTNFYNGRIREVVWCTPTISIYQREQIEGYLAWKWGLESDLSTTHPFKNYPPLTPAFAPTLLSNCQFWYDAADRSTITLSNSNVTAWNDKSGNGRNLARGSTPGPFYTSNFNGSYPTVQAISASNGHMRVSNIASSAMQSATGSTFFLVFNFDSGRIITQYAEPRFISMEISNVTQRYDYGPLGANVQRALPAPYTYSNAQIFTLVLNATTSNYTIYQTGLQLSNTTGVTPITLAYTKNLNFFAGDSSLLPGYLKLSEFLGYNRPLDSNERRRVEGYLAWKWGLQSNLPVDHPYKTVKP
jgi:hypothetical protein